MTSSLPAQAIRRPARQDLVHADLLAAALKKAGVQVEHRVHDRVTHEFSGTAPVVAKAKDAQLPAGQPLQKSPAANAASSR